MMNNFSNLNIIYRAMAIFFNNLIVEIGLKVVKTIPNPVATIASLKFFRYKPISDRDYGLIHLIIMIFYIGT